MKYEAPIALIYAAVILTLMEYFFIPPRAEVWLSGSYFTNWMVPSLNAGIVWSLACFIGFFVLPILISKYFFKRSFKENGLNTENFFSHIKIYLGLYVLMLPFIYYASLQPAFKNIYPFVPEAKNSIQSFVIWQAAYVVQFFSLESFFRGYLLFSINRQTDKWIAISTMTLPYVMIHFHKPVLECFGAVVAGVVLGHLSIKYRSWLGGAILHSLVGVTLDTISSAGSLFK